MIWIIIIFLVFIFVIFLFNQHKQPAGEYHKSQFLSPAENDFFKVLNAAVGSKYRIFAKVRLADIISPNTSDRSLWQSRFNKISAKHVDFLLCSLTNNEPVCVIELNDSSHLSNDRIERDSFLVQALKSAQIPIAIFRAGRTYTDADIRSNIDSVISPVLKETKVPNCPKCGKPMVLRTSHYGSNQWHKFWGCSDYPLCKGILEITNQQK